MNSLYTLGVRQTNSIQADLERLRAGDTSASLMGQISASLAAMNRTLEDYDSMAKREMIKAKQEKAMMRVQKFRTDYSEFRSQFERLKTERSAVEKAELLGASSSSATPLSGASASDSRRRFAPVQQSGLGASLSDPSESPFRTPTPQLMTTSREDHALREHSFIQNTENRLDEFIAQCRAVFGRSRRSTGSAEGNTAEIVGCCKYAGLE